MTPTDESNQMPESLEGINRIIHEPSRLTIMAHLYVVDNADFLFLVRQTGMTWGNFSSHISKLEAAGYIDIKKEFIGKKPHTVASLSKAGRLAFEAYSGSMKQLLEKSSG